MSGKINWRKTSLSLLLSVSIAGSVIPAVGAAPAESAITLSDHDTEAAAKPSYQLSSSLKVQVKSLVNESSSDGLRIGVVIRLKNTESKVAKIPDLDLHVRAADGNEYTLQASVFNAHTIRPNADEELSYMVMVDRRDSVEMTELAWMSVDWYAYPRIEKELLAIPVTGLSWNGPLSTINDPEAKKTWGEAFQIPSINSPLFYTPVAITKESTQQGMVSTVKLLVENRSDRKETLPEFSLDGKTAYSVSGDPSVFSGKRVEQGTLTLEPKEQRYIHMAIPTDKATLLSSLNLLTTETFKQLDPKGAVTLTPYVVGRMNVTLPVSGQADLPVQSVPYELKTPFVFDSITDVIDPHLAVSLVELHMHENEGEGYQTAIGKFKITNNGDQPLPLPAFQTKLLTKNGVAYTGSRQTTTTQEVMPDTSYVVSYSFILPMDMKDTSFVLKMLDTKSAAPISTTLGAYQVAIQPNELDSDKLSFYPFDVKLNYWALEAKTIVTPASPVVYTYRLKLDLDIKRQEQVITDQNFSKMSLELVGPTGKLLSVKQLSFTGVNRLVSGLQFIQFDNLRTDEQEFPITVNIYESVMTPTGEAKRLVSTLKQ